MKAALLLAALAACTDAAVEMTLVPAKTSASIDLSCVTAVDLVAIPQGDHAPLDIGLRENVTNTRVPCVDLARPPKSFADVESEISGRFDMPLPPEGLAGVALRGRAGSCAEVPAYHEAVFYGAATYEKGQDQLAIPVRYNLSCDKAMNINVHAIDLVELVKTKTCTPKTDGTVYVGTVRPTLLDAMKLSPLEFEAGPQFLPPDPAGVPMPSFSSSFAGTCVSAAWENQDSGSSTCINPGPTACSGSDVEVPTVSYAYAESAFGSVPPNGAAVLGAVWSNKAPAGPVTGAQIVVDEGGQATVSFGDVGTTSFKQLQGATATNASGMFVLFSNQVTGITVSAPGHASRHVFVGGGPDAPATALVVLD